MKLQNQINLSNKNIIINGGLGLIGSQISSKCLQNGAKILIIDKNKKNLNLFLKKNLIYSDNIQVLIKDTANKKNIKNIISSVKKFKNFDTFINCAYPRDNNWKENNFDGKNISSFLKNVELNFLSNIYFTKEIAEIMKKRKINSSIILFSSIYGMVGQDLDIYNNSKIRENISYSFIKGGILNYTKLMASYYGKYKIRVNCISPGGIKDQSGVQDKNFIKNYSKRVPIKRMADSEEIANTALFLCSDLSTYMNGSNLVVDGGWTSI